MKVALIVSYFGAFPSYFQLFLNSCGKNPCFDWIIFSDNTKPYVYPENVHFQRMSFEECRELVQSKFDFHIALHTPQKLCDYKCAYGYIFSDYLIDYDWWGYCDLDQIFGDLGAFITPKMLESYDKIGSVGHLTLCRNTAENNCIFMTKDRYRVVFSVERGCGFDEWLPGNVNEVFIESGRKVFLRNLGADINPYRSMLQTVDFDIEKRRYVLNAVTNSVFLWNDGCLTQISEGGVREYPYVHLQKRQFLDKRSDNASDKYFIVPGYILDGTANPKKMLRLARLLGLINTQFFKVKWKSLCYRLKRKDWQFNNVFR